MTGTGRRDDSHEPTLPESALGVPVAFAAKVHHQPQKYPRIRMHLAQEDQAHFQAGDVSVTQALQVRV